MEESQHLGVNTVEVRPIGDEMLNEANKEGRHDKMHRLNNALIFALPGLMLAFYLIYFPLTI